MDIRQYAKDFAILHARMERKLAPIFYKALAETVTPVLSSLNPDSILQAPWINAYNQAYAQLIVFSRQEYKQLKANNPTKDEISFFDEQWRLLMQQYGNDIAWDFATDLNDTTIAQIRRAIADSGADYLTNSQTARLIRQYTLGDIGKVRSLLIARTETTTGANKAKEIAAKTYFDEIGETEGYKMWVTRMDGHERHDHATVNNTAVPFNDNFTVGGFEANLPGDPKLPAKERVRCRCTFVNLTKRGYERRFGK